MNYGLNNKKIELLFEIHPDTLCLRDCLKISYSFLIFRYFCTPEKFQKQLKKKIF